MQDSQSFGLVDVGLTQLFRQELPAASKFFRDLRIVLVRRDLDDLPAFKLRPDHKSVHRALDVIKLMLLCLERRKRKSKDELMLLYSGVSTNNFFSR